MPKAEETFKPIEYELPEFKQIEVTSSFPGLQLPKKIWTCTSGGLMPLMIRQEFHDGLTAILQWTKQSLHDEVLLWQNGQMYTAAFSECSDRRLRDVVHPNVWCLVDSNQGLWDVPPSVYMAGRFKIQAALPGKERMTWTIKSPKRVTYYVMREWPAEELIAGHIFETGGSA
ncbi:hypothetical protein GYMLUDRAFT_247882 [Collybiopsis luxurians FD-317 M1]|uniref:Unplaced genomic scaffold GYMLUscaffold_50, whole genome shotgun sequence n=1 Tax=Collybiopsis luxurians FD-317 M1 TaxID=944289 RepID=A0A0D0CE86_9AGAR|nr:hypothetical protein GYMLUDRAFT_247882 [Collybiopsis luxurians FD-317 M1]